MPYTDKSKKEIREKRQQKIKIPKLYTNGVTCIIAITVIAKMTM